MVKQYVEIKYKDEVIFVAGIKSGDTSEFLKIKKESENNFAKYVEKMQKMEKHIKVLELEIKLDRGQINKEEYEKEMANL